MLQLSDNFNQQKQCVLVQIEERLYRLAEQCMRPVRPGTCCGVHWVEISRLDQEKYASLYKAFYGRCRRLHNAEVSLANKIIACRSVLDNGDLHTVVDTSERLLVSALAKHRCLGNRFFFFAKASPIKHKHNLHLLAGNWKAYIHYFRDLEDVSRYMKSRDRRGRSV